MTIKAKPIVFTITDVGKNKALNSDNSNTGLKLHLAEIAYGSGKYVATKERKKLENKLNSSRIVSGDIEPNSHTLRFSCTLYAKTITEVYELGLFSDDGVLFAVASSIDEPLFVIYPDIAFVGSFGLLLDDLDTSNISVVTDPNGAVSLVLMENHLAHENPHPQYIPRSALELIFPIGYPYWTHINKNPKPLFDKLFGYETFWRRLEGVHLVAVDDNDPYINQPMQLLGQKGNTEIAIARPHVYPIYSSYLFERYNPDNVVSTVWNVKANKTSIDEGASVRFTISANNIADGLILNWKISEGNNKTIDKSQTGTAIINNGQAIIDFTTTSDDNVVDKGKSVKLVISAPANLELTIPINDNGYNETIVHINQSTNSGIALDEYFKQQKGHYATATDKTVRFIIAENVDIVAPNTATSALFTGSKWRTDTKLIVENHGRILGRGGNGGRGAFIYHEKYSAKKYASKVVKDPSTAGENGGTAVKANHNLTIENHGTIAGGGGGGGGGGAYIYSNTVDDLGVVNTFTDLRQNGTASGGGAPFGNATDNTGSIKWYLDDPLNTDRNIIQSLMDDNCDYVFLRQNQIIVNGTSRSLPSNHVYRDVFDRADLWVSLAKNATKQLSAKNGTLLIGGNGGWSNIDYSSRADGQSLTGTKWDYNRGGKGGDIGENGEDGQLTKLNLVLNGEYLDVPTAESKVFKLIKSAKGGKAGYIYQGNVTIKNIGNGISKGRTL